MSTDYGQYAMTDVKHILFTKFLPIGKYDFTKQEHHSKSLFYAKSREVILRVENTFPTEGLITPRRISNTNRITTTEMIFTLTFI